METVLMNVTYLTEFWSSNTRYLILADRPIIMSLNVYKGAVLAVQCRVYHLEILLRSWLSLRKALQGYRRKFSWQKKPTRSRVYL